MSAANYQLVYILGSGHCGSTLLNLLLNAHPHAVGLSEIETIGRYARRPLDDENPLHTDFWQSVRRCYNAHSQRPFAEIDIFHPPLRQFVRWEQAQIARFAQPNKLLLDCIAAQTNATQLIDASKFWQRLYLLRQSQQFDIKVIHLVRNGHGVIHSFTRKGVSFADSYRRWAFSNLTALWLKRKFSEDNWQQIKYEQLATAPQKTVKQICSFLQMPFRPEMLDYQKAPHVGIGGNRMRRRKESKIVLDDKWQTEMQPDHRRKFALLGGWLNRWFGY